MDARSIFILFLVSVFIFSVAGLGGQDKHLATIHVINSMPSDSEPMALSCKTGNKYLDMQTLGVGDDYQFGVQEKAVYSCFAATGNQFASWNAFQPKRDENHQTVFWLGKEDGFFLSWDNSSWVRKQKWQTE